MAKKTEEVQQEQESEGETTTPPGAAADTKKPGAPSKKDRIVKLAKILGEKGVEDAQEMLSTVDHNIIRYAYLSLPPEGGASKVVQQLLSLDLATLPPAVLHELTKKFQLAAKKK